MDVRLVQPKNTLLPMVFTFFGIVMEERLEQ